MIKPTIGRKVWYRPSAQDMAGNFGMRVAGGDQPLDATVIAVWGDRMVNLDVIDIYGKHFALTSVKLLQDDDQPARGPAAEDGTPGPILGGYAEWMPYQVGQAKATQPAA